ncbi:hypothetical protein J3A83DRAFT_1140318 [Scleroderma citrinum]
MGLFSFSRAHFGSNRKPSTNPRLRNSEKFEDDWFTSSMGSNQPPSGVINAKENWTVHGAPTSNQSGTALEHSPNGQAGPEDSTLVRKIDGGIGETPIPPIRALTSQRRSSFFAFSSNRKSRHGTPIIQMPQSQRSTHLRAHLADPAAIPSPLHTDNEDYYYCHYSPSAPSQASSSASPRLDTSNLFPLRKRRSVRSQSHHITLDSDSQQSSPINQYSPIHSQAHPHLYSSSLSARAQTSGTSPYACPTQSSGFRDGQDRLRGGHSDTDEPNILLFPIPPQQPPATARKDPPTVEIQLPPPRGFLRSSFSVPNLSSAARQTSATKPLPPGKRRDVLLTAGNWCDTLIFPRPRLKVQHGSIPTSRSVVSPPCTPIAGDDPSAVAIPFPPRPATASATLMADSTPSNTQSSPAIAEAAVINSALDTLPEEHHPVPVVSNVDQPDDRPDLLFQSPPPSVTQYVFLCLCLVKVDIGSSGFSRKARILTGYASSGEHKL